MRSCCWAGVGLAPPPPEAARAGSAPPGRMLARDPSIRSPTWSLLTYWLAVSGRASGCWPWSTRWWRRPRSSWPCCACSGSTARAGWWCSAAMTLRHLAALVRQLPDARSLCRPAGAGGGCCWCSPGTAWPRPSGSRAALLYLAVDHLPHSRISCWRPPCWPWLSSLPVAGDRAGCDRLLRLGLPLPAAVALLLAVGWLGFGEASLTPSGPPFLLARSWEDGPARAYLAAACPAAGWAICAASRPAGADPRRSSCGGRTTATGAWTSPPGRPCAPRRRRSCCGALLADPLGQLRAALANAAPPARPVRARRFRARPRCRGDAGRLHLRLSAARRRRPSGASAGSAPSIYASTAVAVALVAVAGWRRGARADGRIASWSCSCWRRCCSTPRSAVPCPDRIPAIRRASSGCCRCSPPACCCGLEPAQRSSRVPAPRGALISSSSPRSAASLARHRRAARARRGGRPRSARRRGRGRRLVAGAGRRARRARSSFCAPLIV